MEKFFESRLAARLYAASSGGKVHDRGAACKEIKRWAVVAKDAIIGKVPEVKEIEPDNIVAYDSRFFGSRKEAREFAKTVINGKIIDHARYDGVVKDLSKQGVRWEVKFEYQTGIAPAVNVVVEPNEEPHIVDEIVEKKDPIVIMTPGNLAITTPDGQTHNIARTDSIFDPVIDFLKDGDFESAIGLIQQGIVADQVLDLGDNLKVIDGVLYWHGIKQDHGVGNRILSDIANGTFDDRYAKFLGKLLRNSSYKSVMMLYEFLEANKMEILPDGNFIAFKGVKNKENGVWRDWYTGLVPNYQGMTVSMPRNMVEDDPTKACSQGLHIGSKEYASKYGNVMEVSVNPANVVSVPYNYENRKARCCEYYVMKAPMECPAGQAPRIVVGPQGSILEEFWTEGE